MFFNDIPQFPQARYTVDVEWRQVDATLASWSEGNPVCALRTREEILQLYLSINAGGTPHSPEELDRVRALLDKEKGS